MEVALSLNQGADIQLPLVHAEAEDAASLEAFPNQTADGHSRSMALLTAVLLVNKGTSACNT